MNEPVPPAAIDKEAELVRDTQDTAPTTALTVRVAVPVFDTVACTVTGEVVPTARDREMSAGPTYTGATTVTE